MFPENTIERKPARDLVGLLDRDVEISFIRLYVLVGAAARGHNGFVFGEGVNDDHTGVIHKCSWRVPSNS